MIEILHTDKEKQTSGINYNHLKNKLYIAVIEKKVH
jgi:hypothetical protein